MHGLDSLQKVPTQAESIHIKFLNQTRVHKELLPDPTGHRILDGDTKVKWAVLSVLSTRCWLSVADIKSLLTGLSYPCSRHAVRRALKRCKKFGLADALDNSKGWRWKITVQGRSLINRTKSVVMKESTATKVRSVLEQATKWLSVSDINIIVNSSRDTVRRCLRRDPEYKSERIPGDINGSKQWAMWTADTTNWDNAAPTKSSKPKNIKKQTTNPNPQTQIATYGDITLMCAPANKPSLIKAVGDLLVDEFITSGKKFSAYDVTKKLREKVLERANELTSPFCSKAQIVDANETGTVHVGGLQVPKIEHEDVKAIVHDIFNSGGMPTLDRVRTPEGFWEYDVKPDVVILTTTASGIVTGSTTDPDPVSGGTMGPTYDGSSTI